MKNFYPLLTETDNRQYYSSLDIVEEKTLEMEGLVNRLVDNIQTGACQTGTSYLQDRKHA